MLAPIHQASVDISSELLENIKTEYSNDPITSNIIANGHANYRVTNGLIYARDCKLYIPFTDTITVPIIREHHDTPVNGRLGEHKTLERIARYYYWPGMRKRIQQYIQQCNPAKPTSQVIT